MKKNRIVSKDLFNKLLNWLDEDPEKAGNKYQKIREKLIRVFISRGFSDAEDLTDEVFDRVTSKIESITPTYIGETSYYFYGVASKIMLEAKRRKETSLNEEILKSQDETNNSDPKIECLETCLNKLLPDQKLLILNYYKFEKREKTDIRLNLAEKLKLSPNSLRVQVYRIKAKLKGCIEKCIV